MILEHAPKTTISGLDKQQQQHRSITLLCHLWVLMFLQMDLNSQWWKMWAVPLTHILLKVHPPSPVESSALLTNINAHSIYITQKSVLPPLNLKIPSPIIEFVYRLFKQLLNTITRLIPINIAHKFQQLWSSAKNHLHWYYPLSIFTSRICDTNCILELPKF